MRWIVIGYLAALLAGPSLAAEDEKTDKAEGEAEDPKLAQAKKLLTQYLEMVKKKKWSEANKLVHPKTLQWVADIKKRNKEANHSMDPQGWEKCCFYLKAFKIENAEAAIHDTVVVGVSEDSWQVAEKGITEGEPASYLLGVFKGKWYVVDKKQNEKFNEDGIKIGHKGYFDAESRPKVEKPPENSDEE